MSGKIMDDEEKLLANRLKDLAARSYNGGIFTNTGFLTIAEQETFHRLKGELSFANPVLYGGVDDSERKLVRFGDAEAFGYDNGFPVMVIVVNPLDAKFAEELSHRDFLGALINFGIDRSVLGDILVSHVSKKAPGEGGDAGSLPATRAAVFVLEHVAEMIASELTRVKHTTVTCQVIPVSSLTDFGFVKEFETISESVASKRTDLLIAHICHLSRSEVVTLFSRELVTVNGKSAGKPDRELMPGDIFSVRGFGKFIYDGDEYINKKGKFRVTIRKYK